DAFHNAVLSLASDLQVAPGLQDGLVMRAVHDGMTIVGQGVKAATDGKTSFVAGIVFGRNRQVFLPVGDFRSRFSTQILDERTTQIDIQELATVADRQ